MSHGPDSDHGTAPTTSDGVAVDPHDRDVSRLPPVSVWETTDLDGNDGVAVRVVDTTVVVTPDTARQLRVALDHFVGQDEDVASVYDYGGVAEDGDGEGR